MIQSANIKIPDEIKNQAFGNATIFNLFFIINRLILKVAFLVVNCLIFNYRIFIFKIKPPFLS